MVHFQFGFEFGNLSDVVRAETEYFVLRRGSDLGKHTLEEKLVFKKGTPFGLKLKLAV